VVQGRYLEVPGKSNNTFVIGRVKIPGRHKISSTDKQAANVRNVPKQLKKASIVY
jgi:hypothetical protein